jgi:GT2 family glycosyltransferase
MKLSIIIPNYNGAALLEKNIPLVVAAVQHYHEQTKGQVEIIVIDDASTDNSKEILEKFQQNEKKDLLQFFYEVNEKNGGFSPTVNKGIKKANGDLVVLLNSDVSPEKDFLLPLVQHFSDEKIFAVGMMDKSMEDDKEVLRGRGIGQWKRGFLVHAAGKLDKQNSLWVSGGSGMFRKKIWDMLGGLDELFTPFYWEDIDISYRALKSGYKILFEKKSVGIHEHEKGAIKTKYTKDDVQRIAYRNQFIFVWKNADETMLWYHIFWLPYHFLKALGRRDTNFFKGFYSAFLLLPAIIKVRKKVQKLFLISDYDIIAKYKE